MLASELIEKLEERIDSGGDREVEYNGHLTNFPVPLFGVMEPDEDGYESATIVLL